MIKDLKLYMGYDSNTGSQEGAVLIFANTFKEARKIGWQEMKELHNTEWTDMTVRLLKRNLEMLRRSGDQKKLAERIPHVTVDITVCPTCELWGEDGINTYGICGYCRMEQEGVGV